MNLCVIPARGGSKRIPRKNIKSFHGKPMIAYAIEAALACQLFDRIVVSTDDAEIAALAGTFGVDVLMRPAHLADDHTPTVPVIQHAIASTSWSIDSEDYVACIYPCVPFIQQSDLQQAYHMLTTDKSGYVFPITSFPSAVQRALQRDEQGKVSPLQPEHVLIRTQDLTPAYYDVGQFYVGTKSAWLAGESPHQYGKGLVIPHWRVVDLDTLEDWHRAELMFKVLHEELQHDTVV